jgi:hypothetical protein
MKLDGVHVVTFLVGMVVGWFVVPMILSLVGGGGGGKKAGG